MADAANGAGGDVVPTEKTELEEIQMQMNAATDEVGPHFHWSLVRSLSHFTRSND